MNEGKYHEALLFLNDIEGKQVFTEFDLFLFNHLKSSCLIKIGKYMDALKYAEEVSQIFQKVNDLSRKIDFLLNLGYMLCWLGELERGFNSIIQAEELLKNFSEITSLELNRKEANIFYCKATAFFFQGNAVEGLEYAHKGLELWENLSDQCGIIHSLYQLGCYYTFLKTDFNLAIKYAERCHDLAQERNINYILRLNLITIGTIYFMKGELDKSLMYYEHALEKTEEGEVITAILNNIGNIYIQKGDLDKGLLTLQECLERAEEVKNTYILTSSIESIIEILTLKGDIEQARKYLKDFKQIKDQDPNKSSELGYLFSEAIILKTSSRIQNRAKAQKILEDITKGEMISGELKIKAYLHLCSLLLDELKITNELEILNELEPMIKQLLIIAKSTNSFWIFTETYLLQAKLALLTLDIKGARKLLTKAQKLAEKYVLNLLGRKISQEHDNLLKELDIWKNLKDSNKGLSERIQLVNVHEHIENMLLKRGIENLETSEEEPVTILIITEGGTALFSHSFIKEKEFESHLFGGFLTTIDYFIRELFSEGLDRAIFGEYTLLLKSIPPFFITYIFKGDSYYALHKLNYFIDHIQKEEPIWQNLMKSFQINKSIHIKDIPLFDSLITELFVNKNIALREI